MVERRNKVEYKAKLENKKVELLQIIEYQKDILNELEKQIEKYS
jgi:transcriptional accessory protein Tex/SPT6